MTFAHPGVGLGNNIAILQYLQWAISVPAAFCHVQYHMCNIIAENHYLLQYSITGLQAQSMLNSIIISD